MQYIVTILFLILGITLSAQTSNIQQRTSINDDGATPDSSAILDVQSTDKGILIPRMTTIQRNAISMPATGLFDTSLFTFIPAPIGKTSPLTRMHKYLYSTTTAF